MRTTVPVQVGLERQLEQRAVYNSACPGCICNVCLSTNTANVCLSTNTVRNVWFSINDVVGETIN